MKQNCYKQNVKRNESLKAKQLKMLIRKDKKNLARHFNRNYHNRSLRVHFWGSDLKKFCGQLGLDDKTFYLAMAISDHISAKFYFENDMFRQLALASLSLATSVTESRKRVYNLKSSNIFKKFCNCAKFEKKILIEMDFNLNIITPFDYIFKFLDFYELYSEISLEHQKNYIWFLLQLVFETSLCYELNQFTSLTVALSIVMSVRQLFVCQRVLPDFLEEGSGYSEETLKSCYRKVHLICLKLCEKSCY